MAEPAPDRIKPSPTRWNMKFSDEDLIDWLKSLAERMEPRENGRFTHTAEVLLQACERLEELIKES